jgi:hypothetical protein
MGASIREECERVCDATLAQVVGRERREEGVEDESLRAAYERLTAGLIERTAERCDCEGEWPQRISSGLEALLEELAARPEVARAVMRSLPAAGPAGYRSYIGLLEAFVPILAEGREFSGAPEELPGEVEMLAIGAVETIVVGEIDAGRTGQLPAMLPAVLFSLLLPILGPEKATAQMREAESRPGAGV